jgi:hypothetical protein
MSQMSRHTSARLIIVTALTITLAACSNQSPVAPGAPLSVEGSSLGAKPSSGVPGVYALTFHARPSGASSYQEVSSLPVLSTYLVLRAQVTDAAGNPASLGAVTFEYCSYGGRTTDINNPDEAPKEACEQGVAKWTRSTFLGSDPNCNLVGGGFDCKVFGIVRIPRTLGFRFRYAQQKGSIASGTSPARNFVWTAQQP